MVGFVQRLWNVAPVMLAGLLIGFMVERGRRCVALPWTDRWVGLPAGAREMKRRLSNVLFLLMLFAVVILIGYIVLAGLINSAFHEQYEDDSMGPRIRLEEGA